MASFPFDASATNFKSVSPLTNAAMPFRNRGWSSTVKMRIRSGGLCTIFHPTKQSSHYTLAGSLIRDGGGNRELNLSAGAGFTPEIQLRSNSLGALSNASQPPMPGTSAFLQHGGIDTLTIVADAKTKHPVIVPDLCFNPSGVRVSKRISQNFKSDPTDLVFRRGRQGSAFAFLD